MLEPIAVAPPVPLALDDVVRVANGAPAFLDPKAAKVMEASVAQVANLARHGRVVYGLNTGCGPLCDRPIDPDDHASFQRNLVRSHASGLGPSHAVDTIRATMFVRAYSLAQGRSGVRPAVVEALLRMLGDDILPVIPEVGSVGASGDLVELAHVALGVIGEGEVWHEGARRPAFEAFAVRGREPLRLEGREALALMNGTSCETAQAAVLVAQVERLIDVAEAVAALTLDVFGVNPEALDARVHAARPHGGQVATAAHLRSRLAGSARLRDARARDRRIGALREPVQDPYTVRCVPQVLGAVRDTVAHVRRVVEIELNGVTDNPLFFPEDDAVLHAGNFHGQPVALAVDHLKTAVAELALFSERRLARLLDPAANGGLPPFLIRDRPGFRSGLMGLQYCASSTIADNAVLAHPTSLGSVPTNANNQDVVGMGGVAVRHARRIVENARRVVAIEAIAAAEAVDVVGHDGVAPGTASLHAALRAVVPALLEDRPLGADVEAVVQAIATGALVS